MSAQQQQIEPELTMAQVDNTFQQLGCLGHGGFGSVFLAKKRSGRSVALKFMRIGLDDDEDEIHSSFTREVDAVLKLDCTSDNGSNGDMSIVYFRDWFRGPNFACIVMHHADGGTLAQEIENKEQPYTERRICWYALQLSEALAHAHSRGVFHHDVKCTNVLIDATAGGKLLLADFGSALSPGEEGRAFTKLFAAPELHAASERDDFSGLQPEKIDAFALGCILFELICGKRLCDFEGETTLGQFIGHHDSPDAALNLSDVRLPWIQAGEDKAPPNTDVVGYSNELRNTVKCLLEPDPNNRYTPSSLSEPLRRNELSPLLAAYCPAALVAEPGAPVTVDNVQLGMFVQRGQDWNDGDSDGGAGSVGVVVKLDPDAQYTEVAFPCRDQASPKPICCRIGAGRKFELKVGPTPMKDFVDGTANARASGNVYTPDTTKYYVGQMIHENCTVVGIDPSQSIVAVAPMEKILIPTQQVLQPGPPVFTGSSDPRKPMPIPITWNADLGLLVPLQTGEERQLVLDAFFSETGGLDIQHCELISIDAVQSQPMRDVFARCCEDVAIKNWSNPNQKRLFHGTGTHSPEALLNSPDSFYQACANITAPGDGQIANANEVQFADTPIFADRFAFRSGDTKKIILSRVALGRIDERCEDERPQQPPFPVEYHSVHKRGQQGDTVFSICNPFQAYPEFVLTYRMVPRPGRRRVVRARRPSTSLRVETNRSRPVPTRPTQTPSPTAVSSPMVASNIQSGTAALLPPTLASPEVAVLRARANEEVKTTTGGTVTKMCVVCWERPVGTINIPCGHPSLCQVCATKQGLRKLKHRCPECRGHISQAVRIYGKIVHED